MQEYDAADDQTAELEGWARSATVPTAKSTGYRIERNDAGDWVALLAWLPRSVSHARVGPQTLVVPAQLPD
jgi:hypothetical protein